MIQFNEHNDFVFSKFVSSICSSTQVHTRRLSHGGLIMIQRHRLQTNIKPAVLVEARFSGMGMRLVMSSCDERDN